MFKRASYASAGYWNDQGSLCLFASFVAQHPVIGKVDLRDSSAIRILCPARLRLQILDECPCGTSPQTPNPILQSCPSFNTLRHRRSVWHRSSNPQPHPAVLSHLPPFETPDMAQSGGGPQEALGTSWDTAADCPLHLTHWTEDLAWLGTQKKKKTADKTCRHTKPAYRDTS